MNTTLLDLPTEILYSILLYSRAGRSLNLCCRSLHEVLRSVSNIVRARYLVASWHHEYELLGSVGNRPVTSSSFAPPKFVPVLPQRRRVDDHLSMLLIDYCLRFPICNHVVLDMVNHLVRTLPVFGNYRLAHMRLVQNTSTGSRKRRRSEDEDDKRTSNEDKHRVDVTSSAVVDEMCMMASELPKRLFKNLKTQSTTYPSEQMIPTLEEEPYTFLQPHLLSFGGTLPELPPTLDLLLLLRVLIVYPTPTLDESSSPNPTSSNRIRNSAVDSHSGYPLTKSVFSKSTFLVGLLLTLGAGVTIKERLPLLVAGRSDWIEGLRLMIQRDEEEMQKRFKALDAIHAWLFDPKESRTPVQNGSEEGDRIHARTDRVHNASQSCPTSLQAVRTTSASGDRSEVSGTDNAIPGRGGRPSKAKRRRLSDRVQPDSRLLYEAVKAGAIQVTEYLMNEKGVVPDLKTIKALDRLTSDQVSRGGGSGGARRHPP